MDCWIYKICCPDLMFLMQKSKPTGLHSSGPWSSQKVKICTGFAPDVFLDSPPVPSHFKTKKLKIGILDPLRKSQEIRLDPTLPKIEFLK